MRCAYPPYDRRAFCRSSCRLCALRVQLLLFFPGPAVFLSARLRDIQRAGVDQGALAAIVAGDDSQIGFASITRQFDLRRPAAVAQARLPQHFGHARACFAGLAWLWPAVERNLDPYGLVVVHRGGPAGQVERAVLSDASLVEPAA